MSNRMDVPLDQVLSARGTLIVGGKTYHAYKLFLQGRRQEARNMLINEHFDAYYGEKRNITTDAIVKDMYLELGVKKPDNYKSADSVVVLRAVMQRVDEYIKQLGDFEKNGYKETTVVKMSRKEDNYIMRSCGENKVAALAALGYRSIPGVVVNEITY